ncbi:MAG: Holliday junction branch migration protein RuvA [Proteobacteria bacterium]|nr:Holliday junction branch migration protein RuvA [Pseudomonadota bacterium]
MIGKLQGIVDYIGEGFVIIMTGMPRRVSPLMPTPRDTTSRAGAPVGGSVSAPLAATDEGGLLSGGVGYRVFCPANVLAEMRVGKFVALCIETHVREDHIHLYGFSGYAQQDLFNQLTSVSGIGPKVGLAIIGAFRADVLATAIMTGDAKTLTAAPGVGKKVAERLVMELKGKIGTGHWAPGTGDSISTSAQFPVPSAYSDLLSALETLGYRRGDIVELAQRLVKENPDADVGGLVRLALKNISK